MPPYLSIPLYVTELSYLWLTNMLDTKCYWSRLSAAESLGKTCGLEPLEDVGPSMTKPLSTTWLLRLTADCV